MFYMFWTNTKYAQDNVLNASWIATENIYYVTQRQSIILVKKNFKYGSSLKFSWYYSPASAKDMIESHI